MSRRRKSRIECAANLEGRRAMREALLGKSGGPVVGVRPGVVPFLPRGCVQQVSVAFGCRGLGRLDAGPKRNQAPDAHQSIAEGPNGFGGGAQGRSAHGVEDIDGNTGGNDSGHAVRIPGSVHRRSAVPVKRGEVIA